VSGSILFRAISGRLDLARIGSIRCRGPIFQIPVSFRKPLRRSRALTSLRVVEDTIAICSSTSNSMAA